MPVTEGFMPYHGYQTYYRIVGEASSTKAPLVLLHGGPGSTHNYFESLDPIATTGRQLIMYDQLGCGQSSIPQDPSLWKAETWVDELTALRDYLGLNQIHLLGQSWGGMLAIIYMCDYHPQGVQSLILSSTLSSAKLWFQEQHRMIKSLSHEDQVAIKQAETTGDFEEIQYLAANDRYMERHAAGKVTDESPEYLRRPKKMGTDSYVAAWGPNEYWPSGTLSDYEYTDKLNTLTTPTLITSGVNDLSTPLVAKTMQDNLKDATWHLFAHSRHMAFVEETEAYIDHLTHWLDTHD